MQLWGREWTRKQLEARIGTTKQLGGITPFEYISGKARGVRGLRVKTAVGFEFTVVEDRALDIAEASLCGRSLCWQSPASVVHPSYYDARDTEWLRSFGGGLLTTCGLSTVGTPSVDEGEVLGLHGRISNTPAEQSSFEEAWDGDELHLNIHGRVREVSTLGSNLVLERSIHTTLASASITIQDQIHNEGVSPAPLMLVYHCNFGFPLVNEHSRLYAVPGATEARTEFAHRHIASWPRFEPPTSGIEERCYYHTFAGDIARLVLTDDEDNPSFAVEMRYHTPALPQFIQWKLNQPAHYVLGLEPANCRVDGRNLERQAGRLCTLAPGEHISTHLQLCALSSPDEIREAASDLVLVS